jgi:hypothetical protein
LGRSFARFEHPQALADVIAKQGNRNISEAGGIPIETAQGRLQQQFRSQRIVVPRMMKCGGDLNQSLKERLLGLG